MYSNCRKRSRSRRRARVGSDSDSELLSLPTNRSVYSTTAQSPHTDATDPHLDTPQGCDPPPSFDALFRELAPTRTRLSALRRAIHPCYTRLSIPLDEPINRLLAVSLGQWPLIVSEAPSCRTKASSGKASRPRTRTAWLRGLRKHPLLSPCFPCYSFVLPRLSACNKRPHQRPHDIAELSFARGLARSHPWLEPTKWRTGHPPWHQMIRTLRVAMMEVSVSAVC